MVILATSRSLSAAAFSARSRQQSSPSGLSSKITRLRQQQQQQQQQQQPQHQAAVASPPFQTAAFSTSARAHSPAGSPGGRSTSSESSSSSSSYSGGPTVTEQSILNAFPRPNLSPTLHFSIFGGYFDNTATKKDDQQKVCGNCAGPHSTDFCPC